MKEDSTGAGGAQSAGVDLAPLVHWHVVNHLHMALHVQTEFQRDADRLRWREKGRAETAWQGPVGLAAGLVVAFIGYTPHTLLLPGATWQALLLLGAILSAAWAASACLRSYLVWRAPEPPDPETMDDQTA